MIQRRNSMDASFKRRALGIIALVAALGPAAWSALEIAEARTFGDSSRAFCVAFLAQVVAAVVTGVIVEKLKSQRKAATSLPESPDRPSRVPLGAARFGFWLSILLLIVAALGAVYMGACSMAMSG